MLLCSSRACDVIYVLFVRQPSFVRPSHHLLITTQSPGYPPICASFQSSGSALTRLSIDYTTVVYFTNRTLTTWLRRMREQGERGGAELRLALSYIRGRTDTHYLHHVRCHVVLSFCVWRVFLHRWINRVCPLLVLTFDDVLGACWRLRSIYSVS
jgi:hypothetical protein